MQYIDISSSYRNRTRYPYQAEFEVLIPQIHLCENDKNYMQDPISFEAILYPDPEQNPQIAFYRETINQPLDQLFMMNNLPLMYKTERDNYVQLDFLPLMPTDNTSDQINISPLYPNFFIPLGQSPDFYTNFILEDVNNNEYRKITGLDYNTSTFVFQTGVATNSATFQNNYFVYSTTTLTDLPLSNITRYYQGKYMTMTSGEFVGQSQLIINYIPGEFQNTFQLQYSFGGDITYGDTYQIVTNNSWFAYLDEPFTEPLPSYPEFRDPINIPSTIIFFANTIFTSTSIINYISATNQENGAGVGFVIPNGDDYKDFPLANSFYIPSTDDTTNNWLIPRAVFENIYSAGIGVTTFIPTTELLPSMFYAVPSSTLGDPPDSTAYMLNYSVNPFGSNSWQLDGGTANFTNTFPLILSDLGDMSPTIHVCQKPDLSGVYRAYTVYDDDPVIINGVILFDDGVTNPPTSVLINPFIMHVFKLLIVDGNPAIYSSDGTSYEYARATSPSGTVFGNFPIFTGAYYNAAYHDKAANLDMEILTVSAGQRLVGVAIIDPPATIETRLIIAPNSNGEAPAWDSYILWSEINTVGIQGARLAQTTVNGTFFTLVFAFSSNGGLFFDFSADFHTVAVYDDSIWNGPVTIDNKVIYDMDLITNNANELIVIYSRATSSGGSELIYLKINDVQFSLSRPYRIRYGIPIETGGIDTLVNSNSEGTEITLPSYAQKDVDVYSNQFFYIHNGNTLDIPNNFQLINDFRQIISYDIPTNTITIEPKLSYNPLLYGLAPYGTVYTFLEFLTQFTLGFDSSPFGYSYTVEINADYSPLVIDSSSVVIENVLSLDGTSSSGVFRDISADTDMLTLLASKNFTISLWILFNSFTGTPHVFSITQTDHTTFLFRIYYDTGTGRLYFGSTGYITSIILNIWYNITIVFTDGIGILYVNNVITMPTGAILFDTFLDPAFIDIGGYDSGTLNPLNGYVKNVGIINDLFNSLQVENIYNFGLNTLLYSLAWEIWAETKDGFNPLDSLNVNVLTKQAQCYEMELLHLTLPNVILATSRGDRIAFYDYVYVDFSCINQTNNKCIISNNPYVTQHTVFKVPIRDTSSPNSAKFVNNVSGMKQTIKFDPTTSYFFRVFLSDGELFVTQQIDTLPPLPPNPLLQLSATFALKRADIKL